MIYLNSFRLLSAKNESDYIPNQLNIHTSLYPFLIFPNKKFSNIEFNPITIFYGGNGSGKTTLLNIISDTINASRNNIDKRNELFKHYVDACKDNCELIHLDECKCIKYISSEDVFDYLLDLKAINSNVNRRKESLVNEYFEYRNNNYNFSINEYEEIKKEYEAKRKSASKFVRNRLVKNNIVLESNGETALDFWQQEIKDNSLYIIDEAENSLSAENQLKLKTFIEESARFYNCQFIIATHSPFLLAIENALIYDLDSIPVTTKKWTELDSVKTYNSFFKEHSDEF
jgi:predicted ATPase